jgi:GTP-binding protein Era
MRTGFACLVGRSNVGKSTLLNTLVGTKIAATSFRAQMTRHAIHGVMNTEDGQAVFIDTPGIFQDKRSRLTAKVTQTAKESLEGVDVVVYVIDPTREIGQEERTVYGIIRHLDMPKILVVNKSDLPEEERKYQADYMAWAPDFHSVYFLSALKARHIKPLKDAVISLLPEGEPMYMGNQLTNLDDKFWTGEIVREKVFSVLDKEVPYSVSVEIDAIDESNPELLRIEGRILTDAERYKRMIIGKGGSKIKEIGQMARKELEQATGKKIFLGLEVEVDQHWVERL